MSQRAPLQLYTDTLWISPYVFSAFVALTEKGLPFETVAVALEKGAQHEPAFLDRSLTGRVPALADGDFVLAESQAIVEYLEEAYPQGTRLLPAGVKERARARQILAWIRSDLMPVREERSTATMFYERAGKPLSAAGQKAAGKLVRVADALIPADGGALFGAWSIADSDLAFMLHRLILNGDAVPPRVRAWAEAQWKRPSVQAFVTRERPPFVSYG
jgi:glutathione S-transferase